MNDQIDFIYSYTREQALQDSLQVCVSDHFPDDPQPVITIMFPDEA